MGIVTQGARTTIFCAVWSGDPNRHKLLEGHVACLEAQSASVEVVYVFDEGDQPPTGLPGVHAVSAAPLTIYEAWSVGSMLARTDYVGNLNLDDRLGPDAVRLLESTAVANGADLVGGDWEITYDQASTDAVGTSRPAMDLPFVPAWPPPHGASTRLGSGTGDRGTFGPGSIWRRAFHDQVPYPHRFSDGTQITSIGDAVWWNVLLKVLDARVLRLPIIVGRYHSHPSEQAEFRLADETSRINDGILLDPVDMSDIQIWRPNPR